MAAIMTGARDEGFRVRAATLAAAADALNSASRTRAPFALAFLTDPRGPDPLRVAGALPQGAALIYRHYGDPERKERALALAAICRKGGALLVVGADPALAAAVGAAGVHLRSDQLQSPPDIPTRLFVTAACHNESELARAAAIGADAAFLSPVYASLSHPGALPLGPAAFRRIAAAAAIPVLALGGVDETNVIALRGPNVAGLGAVSAFAAR